MTSKSLSAFLLLLTGVAAAASGCGQIGVDLRPPAAEGGAAAEAGAAGAPEQAASGAGGDAAASCSPPGKETWPGCFQGQPCYVCSDSIKDFPLYLLRHPGCTSWYACDHSTHDSCSSDCPAPAATDQCDGTQGNWSGCRGVGCWVCSEKVASYPSYFKNHPFCLPNDTCAGEYFQCSAACPAPTETDR